MNSIQFIGRLTADPGLRFTNGGTATCTIRSPSPAGAPKARPSPPPSSSTW